MSFSLGCKLQESRILSYLLSICIAGAQQSTWPMVRMERN